MPEPSVTVHTTTVLPSGYVVLAWSFVTEATLQLSDVTGVPRLTPVAVHNVFVVTETVAGHVIVGSTLSVTVTV